MKKSKKIMGRKPRRYSIAHHKRHARRAGMSKHKEREHRKKSKAKNGGGSGIVAKPLLGHKPLAHTKRYTKYLARWTQQEEREHMEIAKKYGSRGWEIIKRLLSRGLKFPEASEIATSCDEEPAWL